MISRWHGCRRSATVPRPNWFEACSHRPCSRHRRRRARPGKSPGPPAWAALPSARFLQVREALRHACMILRLLPRPAPYACQRTERRPRKTARACAPRRPNVLRHRVAVSHQPPQQRGAVGDGVERRRRRHLWLRSRVRHRFREHAPHRPAPARQAPDARRCGHAAGPSEDARTATNPRSAARHRPPTVLEHSRAPTGRASMPLTPAPGPRSRAG